MRARGAARPSRGESTDQDDAAWAEARHKADVVSLTLTDAPANVRLSLAEAAHVLRVDRATVGRWRVKFEADRRVTALLPRRRGRPAWISLIDPKVDEVIDRQLRGYYLRPERPSIRSLIDRIHTNCSELGLPKPSWRAIKRRIRRLDPRTRVARREGAAAARAIFASEVDKYWSSGPLDVVQIDHTTVDLIVVDEVTRQPIGRPVLTVALTVIVQRGFQENCGFGARKMRSFNRYRATKPGGLLTVICDNVVGVHFQRLGRLGFRLW